MKGFKFELEEEIYTVTEFHKSTGRFVGVNADGQPVDMHTSQDNFVLFNPKAVAKKIETASARECQAGRDEQDMIEERTRKGTQHDYEYNGKVCKYSTRAYNWYARLQALAALCVLFGEEALFDKSLDVDSCASCEDYV